MENVTLDALYAEMRFLRKEVLFIKHRLIPEERLPKKELARLNKIRSEMEAGDEYRLEDLYK